ncbi:SHOCT domain-containing protein [Rhodobacteraceae bacterium NNCM2]|nr:SHOCT domain-containing protein [Coraliihabitans acroporae]
MSAVIKSSALLGLMLALSACGSSESTSVTNVLVSPEQQRADLQKARDMGIITEAEYQQQVEKIGQ